MGYQIQRLSFGGVFDQAFRLMKENFLLLSGASRPCTSRSTWR